MTFARKSKKMPEFYMIFARKIFSRFFLFLGGGGGNYPPGEGATTPCPPKKSGKNIAPLCLLRLLRLWWNVRWWAGGAGELAVDNQIGLRVSEPYFLLISHRRQQRLHLQLQLVAGAHRSAIAAGHRRRRRWLRWTSVVRIVWWLRLLLRCRCRGCTNSNQRDSSLYSPCNNQKVKGKK